MYVLLYVFWSVLIITPKIKKSIQRLAEVLAEKEKAGLSGYTRGIMQEEELKRTLETERLCNTNILENRTKSTKDLHFTFVCFGSSTASIKTGLEAETSFYPSAAWVLTSNHQPQTQIQRSMSFNTRCTKPCELRHSCTKLHCKVSFQCLLSQPPDGNAAN